MKAAVTIIRSSKGVIRISINDRASGIEFVEAEMELADFANAVTGFSNQPAEMEVRGLQWVGMTRVSELREKLCPLDTYDRGELSAWLQANAQEEGWIVSTCLGTQGSVSRRPEGTLLRYSATKYVKEDTTT
jgi:hypothetical protein